jgi:hypothetical protein
MIKHCWSILCQNIITDAESNVVSYVLSIDNVVTQELLVKIPFFAIGTSWEKNTGPDVVENFAIRINHVSPARGSTTLGETGDITVQSHRHRMNFVLNGFSFNESGVNRFNIVAKLNGIWAEVASLPVLVVLNPSINTAGRQNATWQ